MSKTRKRARPQRLDIGGILDSLYVSNRDAQADQQRAERQRAVDGVTVNGVQLEIKSDRQHRMAGLPNEHIAKTGARAGKAKAAFSTEREALQVAASYGNHNHDAAYLCSVCNKWHLG